MINKTSSCSSRALMAAIFVHFLAAVPVIAQEKVLKNYPETLRDNMFENYVGTSVPDPHHRGTAMMVVAARDVPASVFIVTCTSGVAWDIGPCTAQAFGRCGRRGAELLGALSSTYLAANNLHQITARYVCRER